MTGDSTPRFTISDGHGVQGVRIEVDASFFDEPVEKRYEAVKFPTTGVVGEGVFSISKDLLKLFFRPLKRRWIYTRWRLRQIYGKLSIVRGDE